MTFTTKLLGFLACLAMATSCSTHQQKSPGKTATARRSVPPRVGVPINPLGATVYFSEQATHLIAQGKVSTNLLKNVNFQTCSLNLDAASGRTFNAVELAKTVESGVALVGQVLRAGEGSPLFLPAPASGFFLTESGALATCYHVLTAPNVIGLVVMTRDGRVCPVREVLAVDTTNDVVILQVEGQGFTPIPIAPVAAPQGTPVWVFSHPQWRYYTLSAGIVSGYFALGNDDVLQMAITADFARGSSGAPVFNQRGEAVGIAKATQSINSDSHQASKGDMQMVWKVCTPSSALLELIKQE